MGSAIIFFFSYWLGKTVGNIICSESLGAWLLMWKHKKTLQHISKIFVNVFTKDGEYSRWDGERVTSCLVFTAICRIDTSQFCPSSSLWDRRDGRHCCEKSSPVSVIAFFKDSRWKNWYKSPTHFWRWEESNARAWLGEGKWWLRIREAEEAHRHICVRVCLVCTEEPCWTRHHCFIISC